MKIVLAADLHLSDVTSTPQEAALDWALEEIEAIAPDACAWLGDITACGSPDASIRFCEKLRRLKCGSLVVPGNSELRTPETAPVLERLHATHPDGLKAGRVRVVGINTSHDRIFPEERARLERFGSEELLLAVSHQNPESLDSDSQRFMYSWLGGHNVILWAYGHRHLYEESSFAGVRTVCLRALDPDKCIGGGPQICIFSDENGEWTLEERVFTAGMPDRWTPEERRELADSLGITCYDVPRDMAFAIERGVKHVEWRSVDEADLPLLKRWRAAGGRTFSVHMPALDDLGGEELFRRTVMNAVHAQADMVTVHPPSVSNARMQCPGTEFDALADAMAEALRPAAEAGIGIIAENNHTSGNPGRDPLNRKYGCTPAELLGWRYALEERLGRGSCGIRLDAGHARNNVPVSQDYPLGRWYAVVGPMATAYHLHQTIPDEHGKMHNHHPITGLHEKLIAFDGFFWAWRSGVLNHGPIILEIREGEGAPATWERLQKMLAGN